MIGRPQQILGALFFDHAIFLATPLLLLVSLCFSQAANAQSDDTLDLTFDDVKFEMEIDEEYSPDFLTDEINAMEGKRISIRGYILPNGTKQSGNEKFILVRDNQECCFGPGAALYDCVLVRLKKGHTVDYTVRPVTVEGVFRLKELRIGNPGRTMAIYRMSKCKVSQ